MPNDGSARHALIGSRLAVVATADDPSRALQGQRRHQKSQSTQDGQVRLGAGAPAGREVLVDRLAPVLDIATDASPDPVEIVQVRQPWPRCLGKLLVAPLLNTTRSPILRPSA